MNKVYVLVDANNNIYRTLNGETFISFDVQDVRSALRANDRWGNLGLRCVEMELQHDNSCL